MFIILILLRLLSNQRETITRTTMSSIRKSSSNVYYSKSNDMNGSLEESLHTIGIMQSYNLELKYLHQSMKICNMTSDQDNTTISAVDYEYSETVKSLRIDFGLLMNHIYSKLPENNKSIDLN